MHGADAPNLPGWVTALNAWRTQAAAAGLALEQVTVVTTDGLPLVFVWEDANPEAGTVADWRIVTNGSTR
ncbi:MAG: hypothetical protein A2Y78_10170 [Acidobacteria bacterium RBG_13_68_16]|nr:MAG: hypothetical protein A2Y78_10170 [Acidobacteria bacterium RBG_13_68_16]